MHFPLITLAALCASLVSAHPGEHHDPEEVAKEIQVRDSLATRAKRSISQFETTPEYQLLAKRSAARRSQAVRDLRKKHGIVSSKSYAFPCRWQATNDRTEPRKFRRDLATLEIYDAINHNLTANTSYTNWTPETTIFGANTSAILTPEVTDGPYYIVGERIRHNVKEAKYSDGVNLFLEVQYLDYLTGEPVPNLASEYLAERC